MKEQKQTWSEFLGGAIDIEGSFRPPPLAMIHGNAEATENRSTDSWFELKP